MARTVSTGRKVRRGTLTEYRFPPASSTIAQRITQAFWQGNTLWAIAFTDADAAARLYKTTNPADVNAWTQVTMKTALGALIGSGRVKDIGPGSYFPCESLWVLANGTILIASGIDRKIWAFHSNGNLISAIQTEDTADFVFPVGGTAAQGSHFTQWGIWEDTDANLVHVGLYHRDGTSKKAYIYTFDPDTLVINAQSADMLPDTFSALGDKFADWNATGATQCNHIHHLFKIGDDFYFSTGDSVSMSAPFLTTSPNNAYRAWRINTDSQIVTQFPAGAAGCGNVGYTAFCRTSDGMLVGGRDIGALTEQHSIDLIDPTTLSWQTVYTPTGSRNTPIWDIARKAGTKRLIGVQHLDGNHFASKCRRDAILLSDDDGRTWSEVWTGARSYQGSGFLNLDRVVHDTNREIPAGQPIVILRQQDAASDNPKGIYWIYDPDA